LTFIPISNSTSGELHLFCYKLNNIQTDTHTSLLCRRITNCCHTAFCKWKALYISSLLLSVLTSHMGRKTQKDGTQKEQGFLWERNLWS